MNLNFSQTKGYVTKDDGSFVAAGWAGNNGGDHNPDGIHGRCNHAMEAIRNIGPLPCGTYQVGAWGDHPPLGPYSAPLTQIAGKTYGRSGFYIHGPGGADPANCSRGCIVIPHDARLAVIALDPQTITVTE